MGAMNCSLIIWLSWTTAHSHLLCYWRLSNIFILMRNLKEFLLFKNINWNKYHHNIYSLECPGTQSGRAAAAAKSLLSISLLACSAAAAVASVVSDPVRPQRRQPTRLPRPWDSPGKNTGVGCHFLLQCMKGKSESEVTQSCLTLSNPMDCSLPGSSVHGIF